MYNDELQFEHDLVATLKQHGWANEVLNHPTEKDLIENWKQILFENNIQQDRLNNEPLTDSEMSQILEQINKLKTPVKLNAFINGKSVSIKRDNEKDTLHYGKEISLKIYDRDEIAGGKSRYQIAEQPIFNTSSPLLNDRRGDVLLLINGMPVIHIELKKSNIPIKQATNQIEKYAHEGIFGSSIFQLIQIFVAMTPEETVYFANPGPYGKFNPLYFFHWEDFNNEIVNNWKDIVSNFLCIPMAHQLIGFYTIADSSDEVLKVMRSYQYYASREISNVVAKMDWSNVNQRGGYIWHTTGSGKTMTSFKSAQLIANSKDADKVVFLLDRIELGEQSLRDYRGFAAADEEIQDTKNTRELITKLKSDDVSDILIVTSIQKMSRINDNGLNSDDINKINRKRLVFIIDECHRDTFGDMMSTIKNTFYHAVFFGFTGTPIFDENIKKYSCTADIFGNELHRYSITDGIRDNNVLGFDKYKILTFRDIDVKRAVALNEAHASSEEEALSIPSKSEKYREIMNKPMATIEDENGLKIKGIEDYLSASQYRTDEHREKVVEDILENWTLYSNNNEFSAIFATSSIPESITYYRLFKSKNAPFKFTVIVDPKIDNNDGFAFKEDGLVEIINDYNKMFDMNFDLSTAASFKKDVSLRLAHKKPYNMINKDQQIGLLIVVDQMLTGFDSKWINTLYLDKVIQYEMIIQAFSRTNRLYGPTKRFGIIRYYRKPHTMEQNINKAVKLYSGDKAYGLFVPKIEENIKKMNDLYNQIKHLFESAGIKNFEKIPDEEDERKEFVKLYNDFTKSYDAARIQGFKPEESSDESFNKKITISDSNITEDNQILNETHEIESPVSIESINALKQRYIEVSKTKENKSNDAPYDIEGYLTEIDDGQIDANYMNSKFQKYLKQLTQENITQEELEQSLSNLHKSFASLSSEQQKYANMLIADIQSGNIEIDRNKTFMDYITEYQENIENDQIRKLSETLGLNEELLRKIMSSVVTPENLDEYGRFTSLCKSVDLDKASKYFEKITGRKFSQFETNMEIDQLLTQFILMNGFDIDNYSIE